MSRRCWYIASVQRETITGCRLTCATSSLVCSARSGMAYRVGRRSGKRSTNSSRNCGRSPVPKELPMAPDLLFMVQSAEPVTFAFCPLLVFKLGVRQTDVTVPIHTAVLRCQIRIDPAKRRYGMQEQERLRDLFDRPERWGQTLKPMLWTHANVI